MNGCIIRNDDISIKDIYNCIENADKYNWLITNFECYPSNDEIVKILDNEYCWLSGSDLLQLLNKEDLEEVLETAEEIYASKGLFLPVESAWEGIMDFIETGNPSSKIIWITPDNIPENRNW